MGGRAVPCRACSIGCARCACRACRGCRSDLGGRAVSCRARLGFRRRMGWQFPWVSSNGSSFNYDFRVSFTPEQIASGRVDYNFGEWQMTGEEWPGDWKNWEEYPRAFPESPEGSVLARELLGVAQAELERLPDGQRMVVTLRDMLGFDSTEVCQLLEISAVNQRVLLHRGRAAIRLVLESYLGVGP